MKDPNNREAFHAVIKDATSRLNIPVVFERDPSGRVKVVINCKTIMRKANFSSHGVDLKVRT